MTAYGTWRALAVSSLILAANGTGSADPQASPAAPPSAAPAEVPAKNLKVLPRDWTRRQVIDRVMTKWTADLGVRCHYCHAGDEDVPMTERDFASDARPEKQRAREMFLMLAEINRRLGELKSLDGSGAALNATCFTCHRGLARPRRIEQIFAATRAARGIDAALAEYRDLRASYLAKGGYDFSFMPLVREARAMLAAKDPHGARKVMTLALELGFDSLATRSTLADIALALGDRAGAIAHLEKALAFAQNHAERGFVEDQLKRAREAAPPRP